MTDPGLPLSYFRQLRADVETHCGGCAACKVVGLEATIERLNSRGLDGENVGIIELARYVRAACEECGARAWSTRPAFPARPGQDGINRKR